MNCDQKVEVELSKNYIGQKYVDDSNVNENVNGELPIDQTESVVLKSSLPQNTRIISEGTMYTLDMDKNRLNLYIDENNIIYQQGYF